MKRAISIRLAIVVMAFCLPLIPNSASAQQEKGKEAATTEQKPVVAYRIEFNVREIEDGKRLNSRNYMMVVEDGSYGQNSSRQPSTDRRRRKGSSVQRCGHEHRLPPSRTRRTQ